MLPPIQLPWFLIAAFAVWRATHLLWAEDGPGGLFANLRRVAGQTVLGKALDCFYCLSIWVAFPAACLLTDSWPTLVLVWFALSGVAVLLERATFHPVTAPPAAVWHEQPLADEMPAEQEHHVLLR